MFRAIQPTFLSQYREPSGQTSKANLLLLPLVTLTPPLSLFSVSSLGLSNGQTMGTQAMLVSDGYPFTRKLPWLTLG